ncbi:MAG: hypothetical protein KDB21_15515 [Acidimicrobiales bacterium]|nr:hypothetical protein [Acidimicrobiales bacterium]
MALLAALLLATTRSSSEQPSPEVAGTTVTLEQRLIELALEYRVAAGLSVPIIDESLSAAAAEFSADGTVAVPVVDGWAIVATAVVDGTGLEDLWSQLSESPDHRVALSAVSIRGWGVRVSELPDGSVRAVVLAAR